VSCLRILLLLGLGGLATPAAARPAALDLTLRPIANADGGIGFLEVTGRFSDLATSGGAPLFRLPLIVSNVDSVATVLTSVSATDSLGDIPLQTRDIDLPIAAARDAETGGPSREWLAGRDLRGAVTLRYTVPARAVLPPRGPAPPFSFSDDGKGVSAAGQVFLLLPPGDHQYDMRLAWDLGSAPSGTRAVSSFGAGSVRPRRPVSGADLRASFYMAGPLQLWPADLASGFLVAAQGSPDFDVGVLAGWAKSLHASYSGFFGQRRVPDYVVFLRDNPINAGGGVGLNNSFVLTFGKGNGADIDKLKLTLAHEMFHTFQPYITEPAGLASSWFGEGLASLYEARLPLRSGHLGPDDFLANINSAAGRYYTSIMATVPNAQVPLRFWADTRIRTLPYDRGMLYFVTVDHAVRQNSGGKRSLDDLVLAMLARQRLNGRTSNADWESLLEQEVGPDAVTAFRAFLEGEMPIPAPDALGPCFRPAKARLRRYETGFEPAVLAEPRRIVRGVIPGSNAFAAGLRDGDEIVDPVPQDSIQGDQLRLLTLKLRRGERVFEISYLPRGEAVDVLQWDRVAGVPDRSCAL
jgi:hypothetical protein